MDLYFIQIMLIPRLLGTRFTTYDLGEIRQRPVDSTTTTSSQVYHLRLNPQLWTEQIVQCVSVDTPWPTVQCVETWSSSLPTFHSLNYNFTVVGGRRLPKHLVVVPRVLIQLSRIHKSPPPSYPWPLPHVLVSLTFKLTYCGRYGPWLIEPLY